MCSSGRHSCSPGWKTFLLISKRCHSGRRCTALIKKEGVQMDEHEHPRQPPVWPDDMARRFAGKLLLRQEIPLDDDHFQTLLASSYFKPVPSIQRQYLSYQCRRCGNTKPSLIGLIYCAV